MKNIKKIIKTALENPTISGDALFCKAFNIEGVYTEDDEDNIYAIIEKELKNMSNQTLISLLEIITKSGYTFVLSYYYLIRNILSWYKDASPHNVPIKGLSDYLDSIKNFQEGISKAFWKYEFKSLKERYAHK